MKLVNLFLFLALGLALTAAFNNPSVSVEEDFVGRDETTEVAATSMPKSELGDSTGQVSLTLSDGSTKTVDLYRDLKGGVAGHVELDAAQAFVGSEVTWSASGKGIPKLQGSLAKSSEGKDLLVLKGKLGEGVGVGGRRRNGGLTFYSSANGGGSSNTAAGLACDCAGPSTYSRRRQYASNCVRDPVDRRRRAPPGCYSRGWSGGKVVEFWDKSGIGQNFKIELWWRVTGSNICLKYMAWEGGLYFYNLLDRGSLNGGASEICIAKTEGTTYSQNDLINAFIAQCGLLESKFQSRCSTYWKTCITEGSGARRRFKGYVEEERRSERRLLATDTTSDITQAGWWIRQTWEVDCISG